MNQDVVNHSIISAVSKIVSTGLQTDHIQGEDIEQRIASIYATLARAVRVNAPIPTEVPDAE